MGPTYIQLSVCRNRVLYRLHSRNLTLGVFDETRDGFIGVRRKFDSEFLDTEYHWDTGPPHGTAQPLEEITALPPWIRVKERYDTIDRLTGRLVDFDRPIDDGGRGWYFVETDEASEDIRPGSLGYKPLLKWLKEQEGR